MTPTEPIALTIPPSNVNLLRFWFEAARDGRREDRHEHPHAPRRAEWIAEAAAFEQLIEALGTYTIVPTLSVRRTLASLARTVDAGNDHTHAGYEHEVVFGLLVQIDPAEARRQEALDLLRVLRRYDTNEGRASTDAAVAAIQAADHEVPEAKLRALRRELAGRLA